ncbi:MAG: DUF86 domain-containing protein [Eggerthellaceae bacterium]|nr:DUF86 domain-containing protein [Eggerthellaceae bacterium]
MTPEEHIQQMYRYASALVRMQQSGYLTRDKLGTNHHLQMEAAMHFQVIGEEASALEKAGIDLGPEIPVGDIVGLRNRVSHNYEGVNWNLLEDILFDDVPVLVENLVSVMDARNIERIEIELPEDYEDA